MGERRAATVYRPVTHGSIEGRIVALHNDKRCLAEGLLEGQYRGVPRAAAELIDMLRDTTEATS